MPSNVIKVLEIENQPVRTIKMFIVTSANTKNLFKAQESAQEWFTSVCAAGDGHVFFAQELPFFKVIVERAPRGSNK